MTIKLLPCPFCGSPGEIEEATGSQASGSSTVFSGRCSLHEHASHDWTSDRDEAVRQWNMRAPSNEGTASERDRERGGDFAARPTASLAAQCRMQARENLDPEYTRFMHAVADRLTGFGSLPENRKRTPVEWQSVVRDQRELQRVAGDKSAGGQMAREAADLIEQLQQHKVWAIEWANRAVDSVKEHMWSLEDRIVAVRDYNYTRADEARAAGTDARDSRLIAGILDRILEGAGVDQPETPQPVLTTQPDQSTPYDG